MVFTQHAAAPAARSSYRPEIDGLRGLAIALVVVFHVFVGRVSSGVDVFLFIGGIFFFGPQIRRAWDPQGPTVIQSLFRIVRRLYPALVTVIFATVALALVLYSPARWPQVGSDAIASLFYQNNLQLALAGSDYAAIGRDVSLFQHLWSMSVQFQIYVCALVVIAALAAVTRRSVGGETLARWGLVAATIASFLYAIFLHATDQGWNYYSPLSRFWEIGLGGVVGLWLVGRPAPAALERWTGAAGWLGLALIAGTGLVFDGAAEFPGPATLVPLLGALLVIASGGGDGAVGTMLLGPVPQFLGRVSYSLYLWHWPLLVLATFAFSEAGGFVNGTGLGIFATIPHAFGGVLGLYVIGLSLLLAWATQRWNEAPLRQGERPERSWVLGDLSYVRAGVDRSPRKAAGGLFVAASMLVVCAAGLWMQPSADKLVAQQVAGDDPLHPGPAALLADAEVPEADVIPDPNLDGSSYFPPTDADGCTALFGEVEPIRTHQRNEGTQPCAYGDTDSERVMYVYGNSHVEHMLPALIGMAQDRGIKLVPMIKMGCFPGGEDVYTTGGEYRECGEWKKEAEAFILDNPPTDGVFMVSTQPKPATRGPETSPAGLADVVKRFNDADIAVWALRDTPWPHKAEGSGDEAVDVRMCVADGTYNAGDPKADCGWGRSQSYLESNPAEDTLKGLSVRHIDLSDAFCTEDRCPGVIGNVLAYRDSSHITNAYAELLAGVLESRMYD